jgi:hypothetical protein
VPTLPNQDVDSIAVVPNATGDPTRSVGMISGPLSTEVLTDALDFFGWSSLMPVARAVQLRSSYARNGVGFRYPGVDLDLGEEPFHDVNVYNPVGETFVTVPAYERLMARYFRALERGAHTTNDPVTREPWWPEFVSVTQEIERRAAEG